MQSRIGFQYVFLIVIAGLVAACLDVSTADYQCDRTRGVVECWKPDTCGNGQRDSNEQCDDGNRVDGDGCSSSCVDHEAPALEILFPPDNSFTDAFEITLRGTTADASQVEAVLVNGAPAAIDGQAWQIQVPLLHEQNEFEVESRDVFGNVTNAKISVRSRPLFAPADLVLDAQGDLLVIDHLRDTLLRIELDSEKITLLSGAGKGSGPAIGGPRDMALDAERGRVLVADEVLGVLMSIDLGSGDRTIISGPAIGDDPALSRPAAVVLDGERALVVDYGVDALVSIDLESGDRTIVSDSRNRNQGPALQWPIDLTLDTQRNRVLVADLTLDGLWSIDLDTGNREIIASSAPGAGCQLPVGISPHGVEYDAGQDRVLILGRGRPPMALLDPEDCKNNKYWDEQNSTGPALELPVRTALDSRNNRAFVADGVLGSLVEVDLQTGARTILTRSRVGTGQAFVQPTRLALDPENNRALVVDTGGKALVKVDLKTGEREIVSGSDCGFEMPVDVALYPGNEHALVTDARRLALVRVDLATKSCTEVMSFNEFPFESFGMVLEGSGRSVLAAMGGQGAAALLRIYLEPVTPYGRPVFDVVSGRLRVDDNEREMDPSLGVPTGMALDKANNRVLVVDFASSELVAIDLKTGNRSLISDEEHGEGPTFVRPTTIAVDPGGTYAWVVDVVLQALVRVDLGTGDRSLVSYASGTPHVDIDRPLGVALDEHEPRALLVDEEQRTLFLVDLVTGERVIISR
jgi:cysteine-rich repeat protein